MARSLLGAAPTSAAHRIRGNQGAPVKRLMISAMLVSACTVDTNGERDSGRNQSELEVELLDFDTRVIYNFAGDKRYVRNNSEGVKLYLSQSALEMDSPKSGFANANHFENSCAPTAAYNVLEWYGITELEGEECYLVPDSKSLSPTMTEKCQLRVNPWSLGNEMHTNDWGVPIIEEGTTTSDFWSVFSAHMAPYIEPPDELQYNYGDGDYALWRYQMLWATLAQGHPIVVVFDTGLISGHFATIVGIERVPGEPFLSDRILMANAREQDLTFTKTINGKTYTRHAISYGKFNSLWERGFVTKADVVAGLTEHGYTRFHVWDTSEPMPEKPTVGGSPGNGPPKKLN
jgi:hypothetical protein